MRPASRRVSHLCVPAWHGRAGYAGLVSTCTDSPADPAFTQFAAPILAPSDPSDAEINASLRSTIVVLLESARRAVEFPEFGDQGMICTCVGAATDLLGALAVRS